MTRHGALIVFKPGVTTEEAGAALALIAPFLDLPDTTLVPVFAPMQQHRLGPKKVDRFDRRPFQIESAIHTFDEEQGWPIFYIPGSVATDVPDRAEPGAAADGGGM